MEKKEQKVVTDVTTKKKYVKPDFEVIELKMEAPLLSASGEANRTFGFESNRRESW
jgi:hypothetical protein